MDINLFMALFAFVCVFLFTLIYSYIKVGIIKLKNRKRENKKDINLLGFKLLSIKSGVDKTELLNWKTILLISFTDSIIISLTFYLVAIMNINFILSMLIGLVVIIVLILLVYSLLGLLYKKRGNKK